MTIVVGGSGTFSSPYRIDYERDPYIKSLLMINKEGKNLICLFCIDLKSKLPGFLENMDSLFSRLCFYRFSGVILKDLNNLLYHIQFGNENIFNPLNVKMKLYVFLNSYKKVGIDDNGNDEFE